MGYVAIAGAVICFALSLVLSSGEAVWVAIICMVLFVCTACICFEIESIPTVR